MEGVLHGIAPWWPESRAEMMVLLEISPARINSCKLQKFVKEGFGEEPNMKIIRESNLHLVANKLWK